MDAMDESESSQEKDGVGETDSVLELNECFAPSELAGLHCLGQVFEWYGRRSVAIAGRMFRLAGVVERAGLVTELTASLLWRKHICSHTTTKVLNMPK